MQIPCLPPLLIIFRFRVSNVLWGDQPEMVWYSKRESAGEWVLRPGLTFRCRLVSCVREGWSYRARVTRSLSFCFLKIAVKVAIWI
jgi:hypothetical protein